MHRHSSICEPRRLGFDSFEKFKDAAKDENVYDNRNLKIINAVIQKALLSNLEIPVQ
jgi:hypothetical protein